MHFLIPWLVAVLVPLAAHAAPRLGPIGTELSGGGGDAAALRACGEGTLKGGGYDSVLEQYQWTCGNYNWSAEIGGCIDDGGVGTRCQGTVDATLGAGDIVADYTSPVQDGGSAEYIDCTGDGTGTLVATGGAATGLSECLSDGYRVKRNAMADFALAVDNTMVGGKVYLPRFRSGNTVYNSAYHHAGCGIKYDGTENACPILRPPNHTYPHRDFQTWKGVTVIGEGMDVDGFFLPLNETQLAGADVIPKVSGTWILIDTGNDHDKASPTNGHDPNGDAVTVYVNNLVVGPGAAANNCFPVSATDFRCNAGDAGVVGTHVRASSWAKMTEIHAAGTEDENQICFNDILAETGICTLKKNQGCLSNGDCDDGTTDYGPCITYVDSIDETINTDPNAGTEHTWLLQQPLCDDDADSVGCLNSGYYSIVQIQDVPDVVCATTGERIYFGPSEGSDRTWPFELHQTLLDSKLYQADSYKMHPGAQFRRLSVMPANYPGRDSSDNTLDCSPGAPTSGGTQVACDRGPLIEFKHGMSAGVKEVAFHECNRDLNSCLDGGSYPTVIHDSYMMNFRQGAFSDTSRADMRRNYIIGGTTSGTLFNLFAGQSFIVDNHIIETNSGAAGFSTGRGVSKSTFLRNVWHGGKHSFGVYRFNRPSNVSIQGDTCYGVEGPFLVVDADIAGAPVNLDISGVTIQGQGCVGTSGAGARAAFYFTAFGDTTPGSVGSISIRDTVFVNSINDAVMFMFDTDADSTALVESYNNVSLENIRMQDVGLATTTAILAADDLGAGAGPEGYDENIGIGSLEFPPKWRNLVYNGKSIPDQLHTYIDASDNQTIEYDADGDAGPPVISALPVGTILCITDDTAAQACTDAGANGLLDGGGTATSCCSVNASGAWVAFP